MAEEEERNQEEEEAGISSDDSSDGLPPVVVESEESFMNLYLKLSTSVAMGDEETERKCVDVGTLGKNNPEEKVISSDDSDDGLGPHKVSGVVQPISVKGKARMVKKSPKECSSSGKKSFDAVNELGGALGKSKAKSSSSLSLKKPRVVAKSMEVETELPCSINLSKVNLNGGKDKKTGSDSIMMETVDVEPKKKGFIMKIGGGDNKKGKTKTAKVAPVVKACAVDDEKSSVRRSTRKSQSAQGGKGIGVELSKEDIAVADQNPVKKASKAFRPRMTSGGKRKSLRSYKKAPRIVDNPRVISSSAAVCTDAFEVNKSEENAVSGPSSPKTNVTPVAPISPTSSNASTIVDDTSEDDDDDMRMELENIEQRSIPILPSPLNSASAQVDSNQQSKKILKSAVTSPLNEEEPREQKIVKEFVYATDYWKFNAKTPTAEQLQNPIELDVAKMTELNEYRRVDKEYKFKDGQSRWQCPACPKSFTTKKECKKHIRKGNVHTLFGRCMREGCTGFYHDRVSLLHHMTWHWEKDDACGTVYDEDLRTFHDRDESDPSEEELRKRLAARIVAYRKAKASRKLEEAKEQAKKKEEREKKKRKNVRIKDFLRMLEEESGPSKKKKRKKSKNTGDV